MKHCRKILKLLMALFVALLLAALASYFFPQQILTVESGEVKADVLVVMGGGSPERPERAAELFKQGEAPRVLVNGYGESEESRKVLLKIGVPARVIEMEDKSTSTHENVKFTIAMLHARHVKSAIIVTSWFHSRRALACFEHYAPDIKFYSRPSYSSYPRTEWKRRNIKGDIKAEYVKLLGYWVRYGVCPL